MRPAPCQAPEPPEAAKAKTEPRTGPTQGVQAKLKSTPVKMPDYSPYPFVPVSLIVSFFPCRVPENVRLPLWCKPKENDNPHPSHTETKEA